MTQLLPEPERCEWCGVLMGWPDPDADGVGPNICVRCYSKDHARFATSGGG